MKILANIDFSQNELQNAVFQPLATAPASAILGQIYYNSVDFHLYQYNGIVWKSVGVVVEASLKNGNIKIDNEEIIVYKLPTATNTVLGGIKVGTGLSIDANGIVTVTNAGKVEWTGVLNTPTTLNGYGITDAKILNGTITLGNNTISPIVDANYVHTDNNFTTVEKTKLSGIATGAEVNVNTDWDAVSGDAQLLNKPTKLSQFTNDGNFIDNTVSNLVNYYTKMQTYTQTEVNNLIGQIATIQIKVVDVLPATGQSNIIYLVAKAPSQTTNVYDEYIWTGTAFEKVGDTAIDLSNYLTLTGASTNTTVAFTQAGVRENITTGESLSILMGKIAKYFNDLGGLAYKNLVSVGDLPAGTVIDSTYVHTDNNFTTVEKTKLSGLNLVNKVIGTIATTETTKTISVTGTVLSVELIDSVTKERIYADVAYGNGAGTISVIVTVSAVPVNLINIIITTIG